MAFVCILPEKAKEFKQKLKDKKLNIFDLVNMESEARTKLLSDYFGNEAKTVNTLFEEKLILKNRLQGLKNWVSKITASGRYSLEKIAEMKKLIEEYKTQQQERIFNPKEHEAFLANLAEEKLGVRVSREESQKIFDLTEKAKTLLEKNYDEKKPIGEKWSSIKDRADYGASKVLLENYISSLKGEGEPLKEVLKNRVEEFKKTASENVSKAVFDVSSDAIKTISDNSIALVASVDNSFLGRQGLKTLLTHPSAWQSGAKNSFIDIWNTMGGKNTIDALMADYYSRENYINGNYEKVKIGKTREEELPTSLPEKIPALGRVFKASDIAFKGSALRMRMDLFDLMRKMQKEQGLNITDKKLIEDTGTILNSLTARGKFGKYGESPLVSLLLWSPRMLKANYDTLTTHSLGAELQTSWGRKEAFKNTLKIVGSMALMLSIAQQLNKDSVEKDPTSSDFGNIMIEDTKMSRILGVLADFVGISSSTYGGKTRFDISSGMKSLITFFARQLTGQTKSPITGIKKEFGSGYGETSRFDSFIDFLTGKTKPAVSTAIDISKGKNFKGQKPTPANIVYGLTVPISIQNILELNDTNDGVDWGENTGKELQQFKDKVGKDDFKKANDDFNKQTSEWINSTKNKEEFKKLSTEDKQKIISNKKSEIKKTIFSKYNFKYQQEKAKELPKF